MKRTNGKLLAAFSSFLLASVCLTASTFAWFALADDLTVENIKISLKPSQEIQLGFYSDDPGLKSRYGGDLGVWDGDIFYVDPAKGTVDAKLLIDFGQLDPKLRFAPLSAAWSLEALGATADGYLPTLTKMPTPFDVKGVRTASLQENSYLQLECYVRTLVDDVYLFLEPKTAIAPDREQNALTARLEKVDAAELDRVASYMRMSFYAFDDVKDRRFFKIYEPNPPADYRKTAYFGRLDIDPADGYYDFSYATGTETVYGAYSGTPAYDESARADEIPPRNDGFQALSYPGVKPFSLEQSVFGGFSGRYEEAQRPETVADTSYRYQSANSLAYVGRGSPTRLIITVWSEGWDLDCSAYSAAASFDVVVALGAEPAQRYEV